MDKEKAKLAKINLIIRSDDFYTKYSSDERMEYLQQINDLEFKINKENINITLRGNNKYYYAHQCAMFTKHLIEHGYDKRNTKEAISKSGVCFNEYSINLGYNQYCEDLKRFNSKQEMLGFVIGFNACVNAQEVA
jgi:uncharacterized CHY-type Zn-finger protein